MKGFEGARMNDRSIFAITRCAVFCACLQIPLLGVPTYGQNSTNARQQSRIAGEDRAPVTKRVDLGDGLELVETIEFRGDRPATTLKTFKRMGHVVMTHTISPSVGANFRTYYRNGKEILTEQIDQKGRIVTLYVTDDKSAPIEIFQRQEDGTTMPIGSMELAKAKGMFGLVNKYFEPVAEAVSRGDEKQAMERVKDAMDQLNAMNDESLEESTDEAGINKEGK